MEFKSIRLYGEDDLRLDTQSLPSLKSDEILVKIIADSVCMSTHKYSKLAGKHKRAPENIEDNPVIIGHEMSGLILEVGEKWQDKYQAGQKFTVQPSLNYKDTFLTPGYSYSYFGGDATYGIIPSEVMEMDCLIPYEGDSFYETALAEPIACVIAGYKRMYHTSTTTHDVTMGVKPAGDLIIFGACGPMGLASIDYGLQMDNGPQRIVAVDISSERLGRAAKVLSAPEGKELVYVNAQDHENLVEYLVSLTEGKGYDDAFVYAPVKSLIENAFAVLGNDGCLNFFAGPTDKELSATINMYEVHYAYKHVIGFTGSINDDLLEAIELTEAGRLNPSVMVTHIGGLESAIEATKKLPEIPGGKKLIYTHVDLPLTAIDDFESLGESDPLYKALAESCAKHKGCWNKESEGILLSHFGIATKLQDDLAEITA